MSMQLSPLLKLAIEIQQIPSPTFQEHDRAEFVRQHFLAEHLSGVEVDSVGNVFACLPSHATGRPVVVSAHMDTVFPAGTDLKAVPEGDLRLHAPGIGDNSLGVAALFGLLWELRAGSFSLPGDLWLVANTCEEGLGDLRGMRSVVDRFKNTPLAYIVLEGLSLGHIYHRGLGVCRHRITIRTSGGHSWIDHGKPSAIHELAALANRLLALEIPATPRSSLNIGMLSGGSSVNTIAAEAMLELDLRSVEEATLERLAGEVESLADAAVKPGVSVTVERIGRRPSGGITTQHPLVRLAQDCLQELGIQPHLNTGSTDANLPLSRAYPAITIGLTTGGGAHTVNEFIDLQPLDKGMAQLVRLVSRVWERLPAI